MQEWVAKFWSAHGERVVFMVIATLFGVVFYAFMPDMKGEAKTILIGIAMLCFNKARGGNGGAGKQGGADGANDSAR